MQPWAESGAAPAGPSDVTAMRALAAGLEARFQRMVSEAPAVTERARAVQVTEKSRDGLITVTVGSRGELIRLDIDPRIYRRPDSRALADTIADTIQRAAATAQERVLEAFEPLVPRAEMKAHLAGDLNGVLDGMTAAMLGQR